jgi:hypothetical protein
MESLLIVEAVLLWTGWGREMKPSRDDSVLVKHYGEKVAIKLLSVIKSLEDDFYSSDARFVAENLQDMEKLASEQFRKKHLRIENEIVKAFAWCYTFDFK